MTQTPSSVDWDNLDHLLGSCDCLPPHDHLYDPRYKKQAIQAHLTQEVIKGRLDELKRIMNGQKTIRSYITGSGGEEQIVTYEFANTELKDRIKALTNELEGVE